MQFFEMIRLKGELKLYRKSLIVYYISLVGLDLIAYLFTKNLTLLFIATIVSWIISIIYMLYNLKLKFEYPDKISLKNVIKYGFAYSAERVLSRIFLLLYGVLASNMGTENYSIHTICYSVCLSLEIITNAYQATLMIKVPDGKNYEEQYNKCMDMKNKCFPLIILLNFIFHSYIYLYPMEVYLYINVFLILYFIQPLYLDFINMKHTKHYVFHRENHLFY